MTLSAYRDISGMFTTKGDEQVEKTATSFYASGYEFIKPDPDMEIEDEEDLLYGESGKALKMTSVCIYNLRVNGRGSIISGDNLKQSLEIFRKTSKKFRTHLMKLDVCWTSLESTN